MTSLFEYRIVKTSDGQFMPQRGLPEGGLSPTFFWRDAVPAPAPTLELAQAYVASLQKFDATQTQGEVVWRAV